MGPTFPIFPTFLICSYFSLLFLENALLSLLFHSKMSFTHKNPEIFPLSLRSLKILEINLFFMPPKEVWEAYSNRTVRPSRFRVSPISPIFFEVGIPNLVCEYILEWQSVAYHFPVTETLTLASDLVFRIIVSGAYLLYYLR